jgi:hypothetical protein
MLSIQSYQVVDTLRSAFLRSQNSTMTLGTIISLLSTTVHREPQKLVILVVCHHIVFWRHWCLQTTKLHNGIFLGCWKRRRCVATECPTYIKRIDQRLRDADPGDN